jgi:hypothetical protein
VTVNQDPAPISHQNFPDNLSLYNPYQLCYKPQAMTWPGPSASLLKV